MQTDFDAAVAELAPQGSLRVAINFGNPVLAQQHPSSGAPMGVSADLATELARRLNVALQFKTYDSAGKVFADADQDAWDVAFMAIDPIRAEKVAFTRPYVIIEGTYLVRSASPLTTIGGRGGFTTGERLTLVKLRPKRGGRLSSSGPSPKRGWTSSKYATHGRQ